MVDTTEIGANIRAVRKQMGLTQEELAKMAGLSTMSIRRYEKGERIITDETLMRIAEVLKIDWHKLKGWVFWRYNADGFEIWGPPESETELDQIFADVISKRHSSQKQANNRINIALDKLNEEGQQKAVERVEELTEIPRYQKELETPPQAPPHKTGDTTPEE